MKRQNGVESWRLAVWFAALVLGIGLAIGKAAETGPVSEWSYDQVRRAFEEAEDLSEASISSPSPSTITVIYRGRYLNYSRNQLSEKARAQIDRITQAQTARDNSEGARLGMLRVVDGVTNNLLRPPLGWVTIPRARVFQKTEDGLLVELESRGYALNLIFVRNHPKQDGAAEGDVISISAKQVASLTYTTRGGSERTVRQYDCGTLPGAPARPSLVGEKKPNLGVDWSSTGTGFFITADGVLATCHHVIEDGRTYKVRAGDRTLPAAVIAMDPTNDVALLRVSGKFQPLPLNTNGLALGMEVFTIGFPNISMQGVAPKFTDGKVSSLKGAQDADTRLQMSVPVQPGNSGGPLVDSSGNVVGVVVARLSDMATLRRTQSLPQNVNYSVKVEALAALVRQAGLQSQVNFTPTRQEKQAAISAVESSVVLILSNH